LAEKDREQKLETYRKSLNIKYIDKFDTREFSEQNKVSPRQ
jgi:hypothetical protein